MCQHVSACSGLFLTLLWCDILCCKLPVECYQTSHGTSELYIAVYNSVAELELGHGSLG